jgi:tryptophanyl-tRNA synthetase
MAVDALPPRVLSGIQPSGTIHLGNYFGAIRQQVALQDEFPNECLYFIADYHALTTVRDPAALRQNVFDLAVTYLACGVDPAKSMLFRQSDIPEVCELTWLLSTVTGMGLLERAVSYKDKVDQGIKPSVGLFTYPILMAADILIYRSSLVPVGKDQVQHIEMTQDMATHFNEAFARETPVLRRPEWRLSKSPYVPGVDGRKMSKSYGNTLPLFLTGKPLRKSLDAIVTDSTPYGDPLPWKTDNVYALLELVCSDEELAEIRGFYEAGAWTPDGAPQKFGYGHAKNLLSAKLDELFAPARARRDEFLAHPDDVEDILRSSAAKARVLARETIDACRQACGIA